MLSWDHVSVEFDGKRAVDDVTLQIGEGEWVAMIGANGSGKSDPHRADGGLTKPSAGQVRFRGQPIRPGKVFEHAAQVALLLQAADEMLFEETVIGELRVRLPVPRTATRSGAERRRKRSTSLASAGWRR